MPSESGRRFRARRVAHLPRRSARARLFSSTLVMLLVAPALGRAAVPAQVSIGFRFACAVATTGGVECWGANELGKLGDGTTDYRLDPVPVVGLSSGVASVDAGEYHACAVSTGGGARCWGNNADGQLGDGTTTDSSTPVRSHHPGRRSAAHERRERDLGR
jgi:hypothetical protein